MNESVSSHLYNTIKSLMKLPELDQFLLGGGTNLAIKYNYRVSTDIDLFCPEQVSFTELSLIKSKIESLFGKENCSIQIKNKDSKFACFLTGFANGIRLDVIHNIPFNHPVQIVDGIRLVNDIDIGALKLISASDRGSRKDFYDLYFLSNKYSLDVLFNEYLVREEKYIGEKFQNLFSVTNSEKLRSCLYRSLSSLGDFREANLTQNNKIIIPENSIFKQVSWFDIRENWKKQVITLAEERNIIFEETTNQRKPKFRL
ncbi:nucleotidyl transferase AbiEii/AbiGii toxin family protein [Capnocytophaga canis]|uniref:nucleotidyl transferase AbiEii/AbiGii toxin family protein n=1 Tax=Capnocytophaga canis TaxID=1848903 RepID=UPI001562110A|nr:nucleotidyl transferase AbiEii/AbiGii toxin family protein [Capnocytophaga canis]